jgi:hypothetical protein
VKAGKFKKWLPEVIPSAIALVGILVLWAYESGRDEDSSLSRGLKAMSHELSAAELLSVPSTKLDGTSQANSARHVGWVSLKGDAPNLVLTITGADATNADFALSVRTNSQGDAQVALPYGAYALTRKTEQATVPQNFMVDAAQGEVELTSSELVLLTGTVSDAGGKPIFNADVQFSPPSSYPVRTKSDGSFEAKVSPGVYGVTVRAAKFLEARRGGIQVDSGRALPERFVLTSLDADLLVKATCDGAPCFGAEVSIFHDADSQKMRAGSGVAGFTGLPASNVDVLVVWHRGEADERRASAQILLDRNTRTELLLELEPSVDIVPAAATADRVLPVIEPMPMPQ